MNKKARDKTRKLVTIKLRRRRLPKIDSIQALDGLDVRPKRQRV